MLRDEIVKTQDFLTLEKEVKNQKLSKSLLFISKDSFYAEEFSKSVACLIFDDKNDSQSQNSQKVCANAHPDLKIYPEKDKILVADSEDIVGESFIKPIFAGKKIFIVKNIDEAMDAPQNKLLKILEEPPHNVYFLLTCSNIDKVLPTIRSRCVKIELQRLGDDIIKNLINGIDEESENLAISISDGQIGRAIALAGKKDLISICRDSVSILTKMKSSKEVLSFSKKLQSYKEDYLLIFEILSVAISDMIKIKAGKIDAIKLKMFEQELKFSASEYTIRALCEIAFRLDEVVKERTYNVNQVLSLENFLLNILEVKYLCK